MSPAVVERKISLKKIAHVNYTHADIEKVHPFLLNFGFSVTQQTVDEIYYRGYGPDHFLYCARRGSKNVFGGAAFAVDSMEDLELSTKGGENVTFTDPTDAYTFHLAHDRTPAEMTEAFPELDYNFPTSKHRIVGKYQRFQKRPAPIHKMGHFGCCVTDFAKTLEFYTANFNFKPSEIVHDKEET